MAPRPVGRLNKTARVLIPCILKKMGPELELFISYCNPNFSMEVHELTNNQVIIS